MAETGVLFESVYLELKRIAYGRLRGLPNGRTLHATALVHEAYLRLLGSGRASYYLNAHQGKLNGDSDSAEHLSEMAAFFAAASEAMRRIIIDHYRRKTTQKRGGRFRKLNIETGQIPCELNGRDLLEIEGALREFESVHPEKAQVVKMRFFVGLTMPEIAQALDISLSSAERRWRFARAWISENLEKSAIN